MFVKFDDTCATSLRLLMELMEMSRASVLFSNSHCELGSRPYPFAGPGGLK